MRAFAQAPEPAEFDRRVRQPGTKWLEKNPDASTSSFPDHWNKFRHELQVAFMGCCAYQGFNISSGQIDHFIAKKTNRSLTYEWSNYRWAEPKVNQLKGEVVFLDPFHAQSGWIVIDPLTLEFRPGPSLPIELYGAAESMCRILNHPELVTGREFMFRQFQDNDGQWDVDSLRRSFPLLANCIEAESATR